MPTYDYECDACGHTFEAFQSITAPALKKCPKCKKMKLRRLIGTGAGIIFKGSGFYETDYKRKRTRGSSSSSTSPAKKSESKSASSETSSSDSSSDSPATKD